MQAVVVQDSPPDHMVLSLRLSRDMLAPFVMNESRRLSVIKWHFGTGVPRAKWTKRDTAALANTAHQQLVDGISDLEIDITWFRNQVCPERSLIDVHDRALCVIALNFFDIGRALTHRILDLPLESKDHGPAMKAKTEEWVMGHLSECVFAHNMDTFEKIRAEKGSLSKEVSAYHDRLDNRCRIVFDHLYQMIADYYYQYHTEYALGNHVYDDFNYTYSYVVDLIQMIVVEE